MGSSERKARNIETSILNDCWKFLQIYFVNANVLHQQDAAAEASTTNIVVIASTLPLS